MTASPDAIPPQPVTPPDQVPEVARRLFAFLEAEGLAHHTVWHAPTFTVEEGRALKATMPGGHTKNLFMKDKDGALVLIAAHADSTLPLNRLHRALGTRRLSFADADLMAAVLGVRPGSVTAFALMNVPPGRIRFVVDTALLAEDPLNFHPLVNIATTAISRADFLRFVAATGHGITEVDFAGL